jgi:hypothetical protein
MSKRGIEEKDRTAVGAQADEAEAVEVNPSKVESRKRVAV